MTTEPSSHPEQQPALTLPAPVPAAPQNEAEAKTPFALAPWLIAGAALLGVAVLAWLGKAQLETTREELGRRLAENEATLRTAQAGARQDRTALDALQAKVGALEAQLVEARSQQLALETMYQELTHVRDDRLLAEIEQSVAIAAQQLQLAGNVEAALIALSGAETRLAKSAQPQFLNLRKLIARDIERLKALPGADVSGIALKLDALQNAVPQLPLAFEQRPAAAKTEQPPPPAEPAAADWQGMMRGWFGDLWHELRQLVRIERIDRPDPGLLSPRETFFLRENLRLRLLSARLALLARDGRSFQNDLRQADAWLGQYFDVKAPAVQEAQATLKSLARLDVMREPVELNETLAALRNFKLSRDRGDRGAGR